MIEEREAARTVTSTLVAAGAEDVKMGIAEDATAHIMDLMSKGLYGNPTEAVIREYTTNAMDAHVEAGVMRPVEVTTPIGTFSDPYLTVEDFGTGLTREDIRTIYSQYGASTKRATNDQVGMLGLGCKSGFALGDQFTVVSTKDGVTIMVSIERDEEGTGVMRVVSESTTGKPSGTKIIIPVAPRSSVTEKAKDLFRTGGWGDKVKLNGEFVPSIKDDALKLNEELYVIDGSQSYIVMGGVPYPAELAHGLPQGGYGGGNGWRDPKAIAAFVPIGAVSFPPSRESLLLNAKTKATIERLNADIARELQAVIQREVDKAPTPREAAQAMLKHGYELGQDTDNITYGGAAIPRKWEPTDTLTVSDGQGGDDIVNMLVTRADEERMSKAEGRDALPIGMWDGTVVLYGYNRRGMSGAQKRKLLQFAADKGLSPKRFVLVGAKPSMAMAKWLGTGNVHPWADVDAIKLPKTTSGGVSTYGRLPGSYDFYEGLSAVELAEAKRRALLPTSDPEYLNEWASGAREGHKWRTGVAGDDIDQSRPIFWVRGRQGNASEYITLLADAHRATGCYVVVLSANRIEKFQRIVPTAKRARDGVVAAWEIAAKTFTDHDKLLLHIHDDQTCSDLSNLDEAALDDPDLVAAIRLAKTDVTAISKRRQKYARAVDTTSLDTVTWSNPLERYPLFTGYYHYYGNRGGAGSKYGAEMHFYLNAKYADLKSNGGL